MGKETGISWTNHTFNPWHGCDRVSPACDNCYAERTDRRFGVSHWGAEAPRRFMGDKYWAQPLKWDAEAKSDGVRRRVFCASMADVFEDRRDLDEHRGRLWRLINATPNLDWLLLTKRPERFAQFLPWMATPADFASVGVAIAEDGGPIPIGKSWPNVWLGVTAENNEQAKIRITILRSIPAVVHFVSCEPILEHITADTWNAVLTRDDATIMGNLNPVDWLIVGDESGHGARAAQVDWIRTAREAALRHDVAFHFKQWAGKDVTGIAHEFGGDRNGRKIHLPILDGKRWPEFPR